MGDVFVLLSKHILFYFLGSFKNLEILPKDKENNGRLYGEKEETEETSGLHLIWQLSPCLVRWMLPWASRRGLPGLIFDFQVQVFTHLNPDHMLSYVCISTAVSFWTGYETETYKIDGPEVVKTPAILQGRFRPWKCFL